MAITEGMERLYGMLPVDGSTIQVEELESHFGSGHGGFQAAFNDLIANKPDSLAIFHASTGNGKGTLKRNLDLTSKEAKQLQDATAYPDEAALYPVIMRSLEKWAYDKLKFDHDKPLWVEDTHTSKRGKLKNPDITLIGYQNFPGHNPTLEIITLEVKPKDQIKPNYATAAHSQLSNNENIPRATQAYLVFHVPAYRSPDPTMVQIVNSATALQPNVGVIEIRDPKNPDTWTIVSPAVKQKPNEIAMTDFIESMKVTPNGGTDGKIISAVLNKKVKSTTVGDNEDVSAPTIEPEPTTLENEPPIEHHGRHEAGFVYVAPPPDAGVQAQVIRA